MSDANKRTVVRLINEAWAGGDLSVLDEVLDASIVAHVGGRVEPVTGLERSRRLLAIYQALLGRVDFTIEDQIAEGDRVATRWTAHLPEAGDEPGTMGISVHRFVDGRIAEAWESWELLSSLDPDGGTDVLDQVGVSL